VKKGKQDLRSAFGEAGKLTGGGITEKSGGGKLVDEGGVVVWTGTSGQPIG